MKPIGVFDSGVGGLTVLKALKARFPARDFIYLGDTARLPYGTKSPETIIRYSCSMAQALLSEGVDALVIACNTASAFALDTVQSIAGADIPVIGMIEPAAQAAVSATQNSHIAVIGTQSTIRGGRYNQALHNFSQDLRLTAVPCQMLVALAEEGWAQGPIAEQIVHAYLGDLFAHTRDEKPDTLILGCTHFPVLEPAIRHVTGPKTTLINCGDAASQKLENQILEKQVKQESNTSKTGRIAYRVTDDPEQFINHAKEFFDDSIRAQDVELIDIS